MTDPYDALGTIMLHKTEHRRRLERIRTDREASDADRRAAIANEHRRALARHAELVASYRAAAGAVPEGVQVQKPQDANDALRLLIADATAGPANRVDSVDELVALSAPPVPAEIAG